MTTRGSASGEAPAPVAVAPATSVTATIANARYGVMPAWGEKLDRATINMLTAYVHSLGGGE